MSHSAKVIRLARFKRRNGTAGIVVPMDHGLTMGPLDGIRSLSQMSEWIKHPAISGIIAHKGLIERLGERGLLNHLGVMVHLNGMTNFGGDPDTKELLTTVRAAQHLGADAVSIQLNFTGSNDAQNMRLLGSIVDESHAEGLPVFTMLYDKVKHADEATRITRLRHLMRLTIELGTDALKLSPPATTKLTWELPQILADHAEDTAIYFAGGALCEDYELLRLARESTSWGGAGLCVGRNVFGKAKAAHFLTDLERAMTVQTWNARNSNTAVSEAQASPVN